MIADGFVSIGGDETSDLSRIEDPEQIRAMLRETMPDRTDRAIGQFVGYWRRFLWEATAGDLVVLPTRDRGVAIGEFVGPYHYVANAQPHARHRRPVSWTTEAVDREAFGPDLELVLKNKNTVLEFKDPDAVRRLQDLADSGSDPGPSSSATRASDGRWYPPQVPVGQQRLSVDARLHERSNDRWGVFIAVAFTVIFVVALIVSAVSEKGGDDTADSAAGTECITVSSAVARQLGIPIVAATEVPSDRVDGDRRWYIAARNGAVWVTTIDPSGPLETGLVLPLNSAARSRSDLGIDTPPNARIYGFADADSGSAQAAVDCAAR